MGPGPTSPSTKSELRCSPDEHLGADSVFAFRSLKRQQSSPRHPGSQGHTLRDAHRLNGIFDANRSGRRRERRTAEGHPDQALDAPRTEGQAKR